MLNYIKLPLKNSDMAIKLPNWLREEIKKIVRESMDEWADGVSYLTPNQGEGRYYCSKADCEGVRFSDAKDQSRMRLEKFRS